MKKYILAPAMALLCALPSLAEDEEVMILKMTDGTTATYSVESVETVSFGMRRIPRDFVITYGEGEETVFPYITTLYRTTSAEAGQPVQFGFGNGTSTTPAEVPVNGEYGVILSISPSKLYTADVDLATEKESYMLTLVRYEEGQVVQRFDAVTSGTLTTAMDRKTRKVNVKFNAEFTEGPTVLADVELVPVDVESIDAMIPAHIYSNEVFYYTADGKEAAHADVVSMNRSGSTSVTFRFNYANGQYVCGSSDCQLVIDNTVLDGLQPGVPVTYNLADGVAMRMNFGNMQLAAYPADHSRHQFSNIIDNGVFTICIDEDSTYHFFLDIVNTYNVDMGSGPKPGGTPEHIIFNFDGKAN